METICGTCDYYVERPPEIQARCYLDGVCLRVGRATNSEYNARLAPCNSTCNISNIDKPTHWTDMKSKTNELMQRVLR